MIVLIFLFIHIYFFVYYFYVLVVAINITVLLRERFYLPRVLLCVYFDFIDVFFFFFSLLFK